MAPFISVLGGGLVSAAFICSLLPHAQLAMSIMHEVPHKPQKSLEATTKSVHDFRNRNQTLNKCHAEYGDSTSGTSFGCCSARELAGTMNLAEPSH